MFHFPGLLSTYMLAVLPMPPPRLYRCIFFIHMRFRLFALERDSRLFASVLLDSRKTPNTLNNRACTSLYRYTFGRWTYSISGNPSPVASKGYSRPIFMGDDPSPPNTVESTSTSELGWEPSPRSESGKHITISEVVWTGTGKGLSSCQSPKIIFF